ncbi:MULTISPECIES: DUF6460 domain-containing protein [unclassified Bartonella]|uniref:DUF6460 domain-containing protein n=1 Tax=unclassified Bartonella TaxID=2645622 RepID=UPI002362B676|nr:MULTISPECIES: DUF6460 domain-containing protein [unclassified Bartonella]
MNKKQKWANSLHRFLGGTLGRVVLKLLILSFLAGIIMNFLGWTPESLVQKMIKFLKSLWETGFITLTNLSYLTMMGAIIVVPIFLILRILEKK